MAHVRGGLVARQRIEVIAAGDALRELAQLDAAEQLAQLRLADQDDLQQLLRFGLEIGEQAHLLEHLGREVLRLVHHQHDAPAVGVRLQQVVAQQVDQVLEAALRARPRTPMPSSSQMASRNSAGVMRGFRISAISACLRRLRQQRADHRGLAGAHLAGELDEAAGLVDAVDQVRQRLRVPFRAGTGSADRA